ncbi:hypothetical protein A5821_003422 [Enterococcus sp. 7F3_DIV0205]|uniref:Uncharacterized protein n=1 Tax=Candidatus Enterococcus palustris TaxID=1834189 RepID=A0AAQ3WBS9_9ENTE|nr:hypothetical protein [Enterococcus sp. 7F3_DIV0205]OTN84304.1 hypothetical protein A5821_000230 [Enterococcus sp. 7F3_DIV0205]
MRNTLILLKILVINTFSLNELFQIKKGKTTKLISALGIFLLILFFCFYNIQTAKTLIQMKEGKLIPAYMVAMSSFIMMVMTVFRSNGILFASKDIELLSTFPIKNHDIIRSKFLFMYLINLLITIIFIFPSSIVWFNLIHVTPLALFFYLMSMLFIPLIPMCFAATLGALVVLFSAFFKKRNLFSLLFSFLILCFFGFIGFSSMQTKTGAQNIGALLAKQVTGLYPLAQFFLSQNTFYFVYSICGFILISMFAFVLFIHFVSKKYVSINELMSKPSLSPTASNIIYTKQSKFRSLYQKELRRFFYSSIYILNTSLGVLLLFIFSLFLLLTSPQRISHFLGIDISTSLLGQYAPIFIAGLLSLSCTTAASISLEGKSSWIIQSAPASIKTIVDSKIAVNLTLHFVGYMPAVFSILVRIHLTWIQLITLVGIPIVFSLFTAILGIFLNKKWPNYTWDSEMFVVKQSSPVIITNITSMFLVSLPLFLTLFLGLPWFPILLGISFLIMLFSAILYHSLCHSIYI